eukprot:SAG11_NODE_700_length_7673_cov_7.359255_5_plen_89_part_00
MYLLIGLPVLTPKLLKQIPLGALNGVLTFVGVAGLFDCQLWERLLCLLRLPSAFHKRCAFSKSQRACIASALNAFFPALDAWLVSPSP